MSYCTVADIGNAATLRHVQTAAQIIDNETTEHTFFTRRSSWQLTTARFSRVGGEYKMWCLYPVHGDISIAMYDGERLIDSWSFAQESPGRVISVTRDVYRAWRISYDIVITAARGWATRVPYAQVDESQWLAGATVVNVDTGLDRILEEDGDPGVGNDLLVPPPDLRSAAIVIGNRLYKLDRDQSSQFDGNNAFDGLTDNLHDIFRRYRL